MKLTKAIMGENLFVQSMKMTFYGHFVAGEDRYRIVPTLERLRSFGVKPILDYSVEEDLSQEEAEKREVEASTSSTGTNLMGEESSMPQYSVDKTFADRRYKVQSARTYFYLNEATCERNMETFLECLDAVKVKQQRHGWHPGRANISPDGAVEPAGDDTKPGLHNQLAIVQIFLDGLTYY
ncbi:proline dehydrogenase 1, mitochondrial-like [Uranotaenia lowii]|uniref:proline dehydrogenase 1, mitochondrial-like n=1 Tax=Uranotaenia lowii TaxID=190385 RepID=UPI002478A496|nr:proline dehydrogenase 1, mitochondrial-like [Uranotaenia lowii]